MHTVLLGGKSSGLFVLLSVFLCHIVFLLNSFSVCVCCVFLCAVFFSFCVLIRLILLNS